MARNISPFAALTNEEKQIKWMEYQSIRLPYTKVDQECCVHSRPNGKEVPESEMAKRSSEESEALRTITAPHPPKASPGIWAVFSC